MKYARVVSVLLALSALPLVAVAAQGTVGNANAAANRCKNTPQAGQNGNSQGGAAAVAVAQADKCPAPVPEPSGPPTGQHYADGVVFEEIDGIPGQDVFGGEMGLAGRPVELWWNGQLVATTTTDDFGNFQFLNLANATTYSVCLGSTGGYNETYPVTGMSGVSTCGSAGALGYTFSFNSSFATEFPAIFGMALPLP